MLTYNRKGQGRPLVLIHGFCENNTCFNEQVLLLHDSYDVITPNLPGIAGSTLVEDTTMESIAKELHQLFKALQLEKPIIIGHSMGGYVTLAYAMQYPGQFAAIGLLHSTAAADSSERKLKREQAVSFIQINGAQVYATNFIPPLFYNQSNKLAIEACVNEVSTFTNEGLILALTAMKNREDHTALLSTLSVPVFFGIGKYDSLIPEEVMFNQATLCKQAYVAYLKNSGHMGHIEEAQLLASHVRRFIEGI